jgi:hypothetical protein
LHRLLELNDGQARAAHREISERNGVSVDLLQQWTKMRQVYRLLGLVHRHGPDAVDDACRRALDAEVIDVGLIERMLTRSTGEQLPLIPVPPAASRFVRAANDFAVRRPS